LPLIAGKLIVLFFFWGCCRGGVERYIYNSTGQGYQIVPTAMDGMNSEETCFLSATDMDPVSLFPDITNFPTTPGWCFWVDLYPSF
jgi:hypothetical protein